MSRFSVFFIFTSILGLCMLYVVCADDIFQNFDHVAELCAKEQNTTAADIIKYKNEYFHPDVVEENIQCSMLCVFKSYKAMDENGVFNASALEPMVAEDKRQAMQTVFEKCSDIKGSSPCETAYFTMGCLMKEPTG